MSFVFFFSSRRRHTRWPRDWSSDVCSSDLLSAAEIGEIFAEWNSGDLESFLIEITAEVLAHKDNVTGKAFVDIILDQAEQKGTGRWTVQNALDLGVPVTGIAEATFARALSGSVPHREAGAAALPGE